MGEMEPGSGHRSPAFGAAIFDMDGLLVDSEPLWRQAEIAIFGRLGVPLTEELCLETRGMVLTEVTRYWCARHGWDGPTPDDVAAEIIDVMAVLLSEQVEAKPGVVQALASCRARHLRLAVASSSPRRLIEVVLDRLCLRDWFAVLHSAVDEGVGKPNPAVFLTTAAMLDVPPGRCVVFEDSPAGVQAAAAAGMMCVAVPEALSDADRRGDGFERADLVIDSLEDVDDDMWARLARRRLEWPSRNPGG